MYCSVYKLDTYFQSSCLFVYLNAFLGLALPGYCKSAWVMTKESHCFTEKCQSDYININFAVWGKYGSCRIVEFRFF